MAGGFPGGTGKKKRVNCLTLLLPSWLLAAGQKFSSVVFITRGCDPPGGGESRKFRNFRGRADKRKRT